MSEDERLLEFLYQCLRYYDQNRDYYRALWPDSTDADDVVE